MGRIKQSRKRAVRVESARRLAVAAQHLDGPTSTPVTGDAIHDLVVAIGCLQLDPTAIVAPNHLLVLFSRLGLFDPKLVAALLWDQRRLYEYWAHQASIVPTDDRSLHAALPPRWGDRHRTESWMTSRAKAVELVLDRLITDGFVRASDFERHMEKYESGWGARSEISDTLALLWLRGQIVPAGRDSRGRRWALADSWFTAPMGDIPEQHTAVRLAALRSLRALGVATRQQVKHHFMRTRYPGLDSIWQQLEDERVIVPVDIGIRGDWFIHADDVAVLERIEADAFEPRTTLLSPFDNLICDRNRTLALWDFDFKLEIYVPKAKRWGYFVMPLLHGDRLVARFDVAFHRAERRLDVVGQRWEPGWEGRRQPRRSVQRACADLGAFAAAVARRNR